MRDIGLAVIQILCSIGLGVVLCKYIQATREHTKELRKLRELVEQGKVEVHEEC